MFCRYLSQHALELQLSADRCVIDIAAPLSRKPPYVIAIQVLQAQLGAGSAEWHPDLLLAASEVLVKWSCGCGKGRGARCDSASLLQLKRCVQLTGEVIKGIDTTGEPADAALALSRMSCAFASHVTYASILCCCCFMTSTGSSCRLFRR